MKDLFMWAHARVCSRRRTAISLLVCALLAGCNRGSTGSAPQIVFSKIPVVDAGGPEITAAIEGRVSGVRSGQRIVLYAKSEGRWWVQPLEKEPFTKIQADSTWKNQTHLGTVYAALLVDFGYDPPPSTEEFPARGGGVAAIATVDGHSANSSPPKVLHFSGYDWVVRRTPSDRGGSRNTFKSANAWVDGSGALHLRISKDQDQFSCAEVQLVRSLGYGTYTFVVRDISRLERSAVLTLFTWDGVGTEPNRKELAFEVSQWGDPHDQDNTAFVVQPYYIPTNVTRFRAPAGALTDSFRWEPVRVTFATYAGSHVDGGVIPLLQHVFSCGIPAPNVHSPRMNLYIFGKGEVPLHHENEIVIEKFAYYP